MFALVLLGKGARTAISGKNLRVKQPYLHNVESTLDELVKVVSDEDEDGEDDDEEAEVTEGPGEASDGGGHGGDSETEVTSWVRAKREIRSRDPKWPGLGLVGSAQGEAQVQLFG